MKSIVVKEIRLLAEYAAGSLFLLIIYAVWTNHIGAPASWDRQLGTWQPGTAPLTIWFAPGIALLFALRQGLAEPFLGLGSFAIQRPISLARIFWSKALVGIGLAIIVVGIPFVIQESWRVYSNHFPIPSHWETEILVQLALLTVSAWSAGLIVAVKEDVARLLPIVLVIAGYFLVNYAALFAVVLLSSAYGVYTALGISRRMSHLPLITLGLACGASAVILTTSLIAAGVFSVSSATWEYSAQTDWHYSFEKSKFLSVTTVDGLPRSWHYLNGPTETRNPPLGLGEGTPLGPINSSEARLVEHGALASYYDPVSKVFKQYAMSDGRLTSVIDSNGFRAPSAPAPLSPITGVLENGQYPDFAGTDDYSAGNIVTDRWISNADFNTGTFRRIFTPAPGERIVKVFSSNNEIAGYLIATTKRLVNVANTGRVLYSWKTSLPVSQIAVLDWNGPRAIVWLKTSSSKYSPKIAVTLQNGKETSRLALVDSIPAEPQYLDGLHESIVSAVPIYYIVAATVLRQVSIESFEGRIEAITALIVGLLSALSMVYSSLRLSRPTPITVLWGAAGLIFGIGALFAALSVNDRPIWLACPSCSKKRLVTKEVCRHCHSLWPSPVADGAEIFEPGAYAALSVNLKDVHARRSLDQPIASLRAHGRLTWQQTLIWKELKSAKTTIIICAVYSIYMCFIGSGMLIGSNNQWYWSGWPNTLNMMMFYIVLLYSAAMLSGLSMKDEATEQARNFTLQRPVGAGRQFAVRLLVGLIVYGLLAAIPLLYFYSYFITPGYIAGPSPVNTWHSYLREAPLGMLFWLSVVGSSFRSIRAAFRTILSALFCVSACLLGHNSTSSTGFLSVAIIAFALVGVTAWSGFLAARDMSRQSLAGRLAMGTIVSGALVFVSLSVQSLKFNIPGNPFAPRPGVEAFHGLQNFGFTTDAWYVDYGCGALLCYDTKSDRLVGIIDGGGWHAQSEMPKNVSRIDMSLLGQFSEAEQGQNIVIGGDSALVVDFTERLARRILSAEPGESLIKGFSLNGNEIMVETSKRFVLLAGQSDFTPVAAMQKPAGLNGDTISNVSVSFKLPNSISGSGWNTLSSLIAAKHGAAGPGVIYTVTFDDNRSGRHFTYETDSAGKILSLASKPIVPIGAGSEHPTFIPLSFGLDGLYLFAKGASPEAVLKDALFPTLAGMLLTVLYVRRLGWERKALFQWSLASVVLGLYTPLIIAILFELPARQLCPACKKQRVVTNEECEHCGAPWPQPPLTGMEIFGPTGEEALLKSLAS